MVKQACIPEAVLARTIGRMRAELKVLGRSDLAASLLIEPKRRFIYVARGERQPLCRLRYAGKSENWVLEMFKWSTETYDTEADFVFGGGTPEDCIATAIEAYRI